MIEKWTGQPPPRGTTHLAENGERFGLARLPEFPNPGVMTVATAGVSGLYHPSWIAGRPELILSIRSRESGWDASLAEMITKLWGRSAFQWGDTCRMRHQLAADTNMSAFFFFLPISLDENERTHDFEDYRVNITQAYPVYDSEVDVISRRGAEWFFEEADVDLLDPSRSPVQ